MDSLPLLHADVTACHACPRLVAWREEVAAVKRRAWRDWDYWGKPVPGFGDPSARLLLVGMAPGAHGANRTGRVFTGDASGDFLYPALHRAGFANQPDSTDLADGLELLDCYITSVARCVPPQNKPVAAEIAACRPFLERELALLPNVQVVIPFGRIAFDGFLRALREKGHNIPRLAFGHGLLHPLPDGLPSLLCSYHPSQQNTRTGRLTAAMLDAVLEQARALFE
ncbi:MAG: uracil-DNA glycosylase [Caldilineaceae bacterium]